MSSYVPHHLSVVVFVSSFVIVQIILHDFNINKYYYPNSNNSDNNQQHRALTKKTIRVLLYEGCSGSSAIYDLAQKILQGHGLNIEHKQYGELDTLKYDREVDLQAKKKHRICIRIRH